MFSGRFPSKVLLLATVVSVVLLQAAAIKNGETLTGKVDTSFALELEIESRGTLIVSATTPTNVRILFYAVGLRPLPSYQNCTQGCSLVPRRSSASKFSHGVFENLKSDTYTLQLETTDDVESEFMITVIFLCSASGYPKDNLSYKCENCPENSEAQLFSQFTNASSCVCKSGFSLSNDSRCDVCPEGGSCDNGLLSADRGFFLQQNFIYKCPLRDSCLGDSCSPGYEAFLCASCSSDFFKVGSHCIECFGGETALFVLWFLIVWGLLLYGAPYFKKNGPLVITINFIQILSLYHHFLLEWPTALNTLYIILSAFHLDFELAGPKCSDEEWSHSSTVIFTLLIPFFWILLDLLVFGALYLYNFLALHKDFKEVNISELPNRLVTQFFVFLVFYYINVCSVVMSVFDCTEQKDDTETLDKSPDIVCFSDEWTTLHIIGQIGLWIYVVGIPLFCVFIVCVRPRGLQEEAQKDRYGIFYSHYKNNYFWWELVIFLKRAMLVGASLFFTQWTIYQTVFALSILVLLAVIQILVSPFRKVKDNWLEFVLLIAHTFVLFTGVLFFSAKVPHPDAVAFIVLIFIVICLVAGIFAVVARALRVSERYSNNQFDESDEESETEMFEYPKEEKKKKKKKKKKVVKRIDPKNRKQTHPSYQYNLSEEETAGNPGEGEEVEEEKEKEEETPELPPRSDPSIPPPPPLTTEWD